MIASEKNAHHGPVPVFALDREDFSRLDEQDDEIFYRTDRFVSHLDKSALSTVEKIIGGLIVEDQPVVLDLMASWDSHVPEALHPKRLIGLGLNPNELAANKSLTGHVIHDLNKNPILPFAGDAFDAVINTVSVDYMTRPVEVFSEVARILKPGGLFLVIFSNRMFPRKAVKIWRESDEEERLLLVENYFRSADRFGTTAVLISKGKPRPQDDPYAHWGIPSDPIYAVYAEKTGANIPRKARPALHLDDPAGPDGSLKELKMKIKDTLCCPYCGEKMKKWAVPDNPFVQTWDNDFMYICFNDVCPYYVRGWDVMQKAGNRGVSYRLMYHPGKDCCLPVPVPSPWALKESIVN